MGMPDDMIGAIKIKDGLFIGDEFAAQVSLVTPEGKFPVRGGAIVMYVTGP